MSELGCYDSVSNAGSGTGRKKYFNAVILEGSQHLVGSWNWVTERVTHCHLKAELANLPPVEVLLYAVLDVCSRSDITEWSERLTDLCRLDIGNFDKWTKGSMKGKTSKEAWMGTRKVKTVAEVFRNLFLSSGRKNKGDELRVVLSFILYTLAGKRKNELGYLNRTENLAAMSSTPIYDVCRYWMEHFSVEYKEWEGIVLELPKEFWNQFHSQPLQNCVPTTFHVPVEEKLYVPDLFDDYDEDEPQMGTAPDILNSNVGQASMLRVDCQLKVLTEAKDKANKVVDKIAENQLKLKQKKVELQTSAENTKTGYQILHMALESYCLENNIKEVSIGHERQKILQFISERLGQNIPMDPKPFADSFVKEGGIPGIPEYGKQSLPTEVKTSTKQAGGAKKHEHNTKQHQQTRSQSPPSTFSRAAQSAANLDRSAHTVTQCDANGQKSNAVTNTEKQVRNPSEDWVPKKRQKLAGTGSLSRVTVNNESGNDTDGSGDEENE